MFGRSVDISGNRMAVGSFKKLEEGSGRVFVYERETESAEWELTGKEVSLPTGSTATEFGFSVAIDGDHLVVGSPEFFTHGGGYVAERGSAYIYKEQSTKWELVAALDSPVANHHPTHRDMYGYDVDIDVATQRVVIGERFGDGGGGAYVYSLSGSLVTALQDSIDASIPRTNSDFGTAVAIYEDSVFVGAPQEDSLDPDSGSTGTDGAVHKFGLSANSMSPTWSRFDAFDLVTSDISDADKRGARLGIDLDLDDDGNMVVGAYFGHVAYVIDSAEIVEKDPSSSMTGVSVLRASNPDEQAANFGENVTIDDGVAVVTSRYPSAQCAGENDSETGRAYVFRTTEGEWPVDQIVNEAQILRPQTDTTTGIDTSGRCFASKLDLSGETLMVATAFANNNTGHVIAFSSNPQAVFVAKLDSFTAQIEALEEDLRNSQAILTHLRDIREEALSPDPNVNQIQTRLENAVGRSIRSARELDSSTLSGLLDDLQSLLNCLAQW